MYLDFRQQQYPEIAGTPTFTLITNADNQPGSHNFTGGYANYLLDMPSTMTFDIYFKPTFSYTGGTNQYLWSWYVDATNNLSFYFDITAHKYTLTWQDGGTARTMVSSAYASDVAFQIWTRATFTLDLTTGTTAGSTFYLAGASVSNTWNGAIDVKTRFFPVLEIRGQNAVAGGYTINYARLIPSLVAATADVANNFKTVKNEEIVWHYNGCGMGHTRCNVTSRLRGIELQKTVESPAGNANANMLNIALLSPQGQFADDQYAAFNATAEIYNGTSSQKFMQERCPIELDVWYGGLFELEFVGRIDENRFTRKSTYNSISQVSIGAKDMVDDMKRRVRQKAYSFDSFSLCDPSNLASSLVHVIANMQMQTEVFNFLANSSFENTTASNSWTVLGAGASLTRTAGGIHGSFTGNFLCATTATMTQTITFTGTKVLDVGQNWNFSLYGKSVTGITATLSLLEVASGGTSLQTINTAQAFTTDFQKIEKTLTVSNPLAAKLTAKIALATSATFVMDAAMLVQNRTSYNWVLANNSDGAAGVFSADSATSSLYQIAGFDVDDAMITDPWAVVAQGAVIWGYLANIGDATASRYIGFDSCGTFKYRTPFKAGYADPSSLMTVSAAQGIGTVINLAQANKIIIHGVKIRKESKITELWNAEKSSFFDRDANGKIYESVANGATWPDPGTYGEFWAVYDSAASQLAQVPPISIIGSGIGTGHA